VTGGSAIEPVLTIRGAGPTVRAVPILFIAFL
jgi:hypothetical protein